MSDFSGEKNIGQVPKLSDFARYSQILTTELVRKISVIKKDNLGTSTVKCTLTGEFTLNLFEKPMEKHVHLLAEAEHRDQLIDSALHAIYRLSQGRAMTKAQKDFISECLCAIASVIKPILMHNLLRKLTFDVPTLSQHCIVPIRMLTLHFERSWQYYC